MLKYGGKFYDESIGFFINNAPKPYKVGCNIVNYEFIV